MCASRTDFIKISIALKEAYETNYWMRLLYATQYLKEKECESIIADCSEMERLLIAITKTAKNNCPLSIVNCQFVYNQLDD